MRDLPAVFEGSALHPPITPVHTIPNLQDGFEENGINSLSVLALGRVAEGGLVIGVEPNTTVGLLVDVGPAPPDYPAMPHSRPPTTGCGLWVGLQGSRA
jgi:hypothetical protein